MKTQYNTKNGTIFLMEHDTFEWQRIAGPDDPLEKIEKGKYIRFYVKPSDHTLHIECEPNNGIARIIYSTPVVNIKEWFTHDHVYDVYGFYEHVDGDKDGWFCLCGKFSDEDINSHRMILGAWRPDMKRVLDWDLLPPIPKVIQLPDSMQYNPETPKIISFPRKEPERKVPVIAKDAPFAASIHDKS